MCIIVYANSNVLHAGYIGLSTESYSTSLVFCVKCYQITANRTRLFTWASLKVNSGKHFEK